jgi:hypothetical protein
VRVAVDVGRFRWRFNGLTKAAGGKQPLEIMHFEASPTNFSMALSSFSGLIGCLSMLLESWLAATVDISGPDHDLSLSFVVTLLRLLANQITLPGVSSEFR